jgi:class 3 adenylate cyclase
MDEADGERAGAEVRIGDAERDRAIADLRRQTGRGRLELDEFSERVDRVLRAQRQSEIDAVMRDLPVDVDARDAAMPAIRPGPATVAAAPGRTEWGVLSSTQRRGGWTVPEELTAVAIWGSVELDLRHALLARATVTIKAVAVMGGIEIIVPRGLNVEVSGMVLMGGIDDKRGNERPALSGPVVRVVCSGLWGGISIKRKKGTVKVSPAAPPAPPALPVAPALPAAPTASVPPSPPPPAAPTADQPSATDHLPTHQTTLAIMVTDIVSSTRWADELGDQRWLEVLEVHNRCIRSVLTDRGGTEVKQSGDGFLATFPSAATAVEAGLSIQEAIRLQRDADASTPDLLLRVAVHAGEVARAENDVFGVNVSTADKLCAEAAPNEVLVSGVVADLAESSSLLRFGPPRRLSIAGRNDPLRAHDAAWR